MDPTACARRILDLPRGADRDWAVADLADWLSRGGGTPELSADEWRRLARFKRLGLVFERVHLDRGGYVARGSDRGRYYGVGAPLYRVHGDGFRLDIR